MMKNYIYIGLLLISVIFSACDLTSNSNTTPQIFFLDKPRLNTKDSLFIQYFDGTYVLDSICVGDTVTFKIGLNGFQNHLTSLYLNRSDTAATKINLPPKISMDSLFNSNISNYSSGKFVFKSNIYYLFIVLKYLALKETNDANLTINLSSDAVFNDNGFSGTNFTSFTFKTPIKKYRTTKPTN